jgi:hypothetical protein
MKRVAAVVGEREVPRASGKQVVLVGHEGVVDRLADLMAQKAEIEAEIGELRERLDVAANVLRIQIEQQTGHACKSMQARGSLVSGKYIFADRYMALYPDIVPQIEGMIGDAVFARLFVHDEIVALKKAAAHQLLELLRQQGVADQYLAVDPCVRPVDEFREARARVRRELTATQNDQLDAVVRQIAERPRFSLK